MRSEIRARSYSASAAREAGSDLHAPPVIRVLHLAPGSTHRGIAGIESLDGMRRVLGRTPDEVMVDRGYSNAKVEHWAAPLLERGLRQVFDLHPNNRGVAPGPIKGTRWRDGLLLVSDKVTKHDAVSTARRWSPTKSRRSGPRRSPSATPSPSGSRTGIPRGAPSASSVLPCEDRSAA